MNKSALMRTGSAVALCAALLVTAAFSALRLGSVDMSWTAFFGALAGREGYAAQTLILRSIRLPRVLGGMLAGAGLSVSGVLLQSVTGNSLAGPNIIGVNAGAGFAVILLMYFAPSAIALVPFGAFAGAFLTTLLIAALSARVNHSRATVILAGIAVTSMLNAGISLISLLDADVLSSYTFFSVGGLSGVRAERLTVPALFILAGLAAALLLSPGIDALTLGDGVASSLGVNVRALRLACLVIASACAAAAVSFAGLLGFVGLIVPHMARRMTGGGVGGRLGVSALFGAALVTGADLLGRTLIAPSELPAGIVMAFVGAPFFFWLLVRRRHDDDDV